MNIIFDLDGTLSDATDRLHLLGDDPDENDWDAYHHASEHDAPVQHVIEVFRCLRGRSMHQNVIEIWSARNEGAGCLVRKKTMDWLRLHVCLGILDYETSNYFRPPSGRWDDIVLRMRPHKDHRPDYKLKREWLEESVAQGNPPDLVFENRVSMVRMWREAGIPCFQVKDGDY